MLSELSLGFDVFEISTDPLCAGTEIEVVQRGDPAKSGNARCTNEFNPINGIGDWACYLFDKNEDPPRQYFSTSDKSADQVHSSLHNRAVIVYQALTSRQYSSVHPYHLGAMAHEPGHALGLGHYENHETPEMTTIDRCDMLRDQSIDPHQNHYTVMTRIRDAAARAPNSATSDPLVHRTGRSASPARLAHRAAGRMQTQRVLLRGAEP